MSKHKTAKKKLIIEDDEPKEDGEELNPFSFKEFIRSKNQHPSIVDPFEKTFDGACSVEDEYKYVSGFKHSHKGHFFTDPSILEQSFDFKPEDEWTESYQPSGIDQAHDLGLSDALEGNAYLDHSLLSCEDETVKEWELREDFSPQRDFHRRSTGSYEGDAETSVVDLTFQSKNSTENGIRYQEKLREENSQLRKHIRELLKKSEADSTKIRQLTDELHSRNLKEEREAKALESMVQSVEENLQLMTVCKENKMAFSEDLLEQRNKLQHEILALESTLGNGRNIADLLSSDSDCAEESEDSGNAGEDAHEDLEAERQQIQREIEELERTLGADAALVDALTDSEHGSLMDSNGEESDEDLDLPQDMETCLQMNLVYQEVLKEKLAELERLLKENCEQQKELEEQLSGPSYNYPGLPHLRLFLGSFMKPYFKDKLTGLGPPANEESKERLANGNNPCDERKIRRWEPWQKTLLIKSVVTDTMKRMLQPKLSKMEYLTSKMSKAEDADKKELENQIALLEKEMTEIRSMKEDQLYGARHDDHDWDKIANVDFEGFRQPDDLMRFWQNFLHPSINKSTWSQDEIAKLAEVAEQHMYCHWDKIAESLGTNRTAFLCFQTYQRYISKRLRRREWSKEEDEVLRELVDKMRIGNFIPYTQISYFMEGRDSSQLIYRWTCVLDPSIKKGPWTKEEDQLLVKAVKKYGCKDWWKIKLEVPGRTDGSCRDRYLDSLQDDIKKGAWSDDEVELLKKLVDKYGVGRWAKIASEMPNRVDSQCLNKWKWMVYKATGEGLKRSRRRRPAKSEPQMKRRRVRQTDIEKEEDFKSESDNSEDEKEEVPYMNSDGEQPVENENIYSDDECRLEYIQPDMKEWIPAHKNKLANSSGKLKTTLVKLPTAAEESGGDRVWNTVLDRLGNPVKSYVGVMPPALQKSNLSSGHAMIMVTEYNVKRLLICMSESVIKARSRNKTSLSTCTNQNNAKNDEEEDKSEMGSEEKKRRRCKAIANTQLSYNLMLAITPWVGNVIMPVPCSKKRMCEADIRKRTADVPLEKSPMFLLFLQVLKVDAEGCKEIIKARKDKWSLMPGPGSRSYSARKSGSYSHVRTVADIFAERKKKQFNPLQFPELLDHQILPQPAKVAIPRLRRQERKRKQPMKSASQNAIQSASQNLNATLIFPQTFVVTQPNTDNKHGTSDNALQGILPLLTLGPKDASTIPQPAQPVAVPVEFERVTQPASCPTTSVSKKDPPTKTAEEARSSKRKPKPTMKAQALFEDRKSKLSKKQAANKQPNSSVTHTVSVLPQTTAWILTPAGLLPVAGIQIQAPGNENQAKPKNVQMIFPQPVIVSQSSCVAPTKDTSNPRPDLPGNNIKSLPARSNLGRNCAPSSVSDNHIVSSLPCSSNSPTVISASDKNIPQALPDTRVSTSITGSAAQDPPSKSACNKKKPVTPRNPISTLVAGSSSNVGTSQNITASCSSDATNKVPSNSSVSAVTSTSSKAPAPLLNSSGHGTSPGPQSQRMQHPVSQVLFQQPVLLKQNGSLALINTAGPCIPNEPVTGTANVTSVPTNSEAPNINKSLPSSSIEGGAISSAFCLIPTSALPPVLNGASLVIPQSNFVNNPVRVNVGLPTDQVSVNPISPMITQIGLQTVAQQVPPQATKQSVPCTATTSNPRPKQLTFDPSLMFFEQPAQVKHWLRGKGGITLPGLEENMPYLPPFVSSINTLTTLLKGRDSLLKSAAQLLPEEQRDNSEEEAKIAAVRKMVSERFKDNKAYLLLKARFLSCFTLPALLATINPCRELEDALPQEDNKARPKQSGDDDQLKPLEPLLNMKESELTATQKHSQTTTQAMADGPSAVEFEEDEECWMLLEDHRMLLIKTIEPSRIIPYLRQCRVLNSEDEEQIYNDPSLVIRRRKVGVLLDILQRTGYKGYVAFLESLELDYPQLYQKITGKEPSRVFSILVDTAGESGLTQFLMNEVTRLQKALQDERKARLAASARVAEHADTVRRLQTRECELRKQQERIQRMREERDQMWDKARHLKDENYKLMSDMNRLSEEKNCALMCNRDLQLEIERLKHSLMNAESDSKIQRKRTITLKNAMEQRPSQETVLELQKENDLLRAQVQEIQSSSQVQIPTNNEKPSIESEEEFKKQSRAHQELVSELYKLRRELHDAEELKDKYLEKKDELELKCEILKKDSKMYCNRLEDILKQLDEVIKERDKALFSTNKAISSREEYHQENCKNLQDKDRYRKQLRELGERYDELQVQLFRTQGEILALQAKLRRQKHFHRTLGSTEGNTFWGTAELKSQTSEEDFKERYEKGVSDDSQSPTSGEYNVCISIKDPCTSDAKERMSTEEELSSSHPPRPRCNFYYRRKRALRTKATVKDCAKECTQCVLDNSSGTDNTDTDGI
ncbi:hypothetical protein QTP86_023476 [Hemibagrus guttatus]|nr:hypothetical protein QTP86_023476 [Hemibagrus guttatus]